MLLDPLDDIVFWSRQLSEHALFLSIGLEVEPWRTRAAQMHERWEAVRAQMPATLARAQIAISGPIQDLRALKVDVYTTLESGRWLGWLFPLFVDHTRRELDYFTQRVFYGGYDASTTTCVNLAFMREHALFAAQLCDPTEATLMKEAADFAGQFAVLQGGCSAVGAQFLDMTIRAGDALDQFFTGAPLTQKGASVIHPVLAEHVVREGRRFTETMRALQLDQK